MAPLLTVKQHPQELYVSVTPTLNFTPIMPLREQGLYTLEEASSVQKNIFAFGIEQKAIENILSRRVSGRDFIFKFIKYTLGILINGHIARLQNAKRNLQSAQTLRNDDESSYNPQTPTIFSRHCVLSISNVYPSDISVEREKHFKSALTSASNTYFVDHSALDGLSLENAT